jgi:hypothetical protein
LLKEENESNFDGLEREDEERRNAYRLSMGKFE